MKLSRHEYDEEEVVKTNKVITESLPWCILNQRIDRVTTLEVEITENSEARKE